MISGGVVRSALIMMSGKGIRTTLHEDKTGQGGEIPPVHLNGECG
jgi:hypothetical protein